MEHGEGSFGGIGIQARAIAELALVVVQVAAEGSQVRADFPAVKVPADAQSAAEAERIGRQRHLHEGSRQPRCLVHQRLRDSLIAQREYAKARPEASPEVHPVAVPVGQVQLQLDGSGLTELPNDAAAQAAEIEPGLVLEDSTGKVGVLPLHPAEMDPVFAAQTG